MQSLVPKQQLTRMDWVSTVHRDSCGLNQMHPQHNFLSGDPLIPAGLKSNTIEDNEPWIEYYDKPIRNIDLFDYKTDGTLLTPEQKDPTANNYISPASRLSSDPYSDVAMRIKGSNGPFNLNGQLNLNQPFAPDPIGRGSYQTIDGVTIHRRGVNYVEQLHAARQLYTNYKVIGAKCTLTWRFTGVPSTMVREQYDLTQAGSNPLGQTQQPSIMIWVMQQGLDQDGDTFPDVVVPKSIDEVFENSKQFGIRYKIIKPGDFKSHSLTVNYSHNAFKFKCKGQKARNDQGDTVGPKGDWFQGTFPVHDETAQDDLQGRNDGIKSGIGKKPSFTSKMYYGAIQLEKGWEARMKITGAQGEIGNPEEHDGVVGTERDATYSVRPGVMLTRKIRYLIKLENKRPDSNDHYQV